MSQVDNRIVKMQFDNKQFESGCKQTLDTLSKLKNSLNFEGAGDSIKKLASQISALPLDGIAKGVDSMAERFSAWGIAADQVIRRITNSAITAGKTIATAMTIDPVKTGFEEYETQINAVQTILANTSSKGTTIDQVNDALDELNHYADKTIYNFTEMTRNIGTFTAAGVDLNTSVTAIKGIANLAAISGSSSQQASVAMYQLSQALASGTVKLQDWNSVVNAGMGGEVFQNALKETARVHGLAIDQMIEDEGSFRETLSKGWLTADILTETLAKFTDETTELGKTATDAATVVKTFTQLWDTMKEAVQSGWTETWQLIIGDFEEAKKTLTGVNNFVDNLIQRYNEARNSQLRFWKDNGGRDKLIQALTNAVEALKTVIIPVGQAFKDMIPAMTGKKMLAITDAFANLTANMKLGTPEMGKVYMIAKGFISIFKTLNTIVGYAIKAISPATDRILPTLLTMISNIASAFVAFSNELSQNTSLLEIFREVVYTIQTVFTAFSKAFKEQFPSVGKSIKSGTSIVFKLLNAVKKLTGSFTQSIATAEGFNALFKGANGIISVFKLFITIIDDVTDGLKLNGKSATSLMDVLLNVVAVVGDLLSFASELIQKTGIIKIAVKVLSGVLNVLITVITTVVDVVTTLIRKIADFVTSNESVQKILSAIKTGLEKVGDAFSQLKDKAVEMFQAIMDSEGVQNLKKEIENLWDVIAPIASESFTKATDNLSSFISVGAESSSFTNFVDLVSKMANGIAKFISVLASGGDPLETIRGGLAKLLNPFETFGKVYKWLQGIMKNGIVGTALKEIDNAVSGFVTDDMMNVIGTGISDFFEKIGDVITGYDWNNITNTIIKITSGLLGIKALTQLTSTLKSIQGTFTSVTGMFTSVKNLADTAKKSIKMEIFKSFAASVLMLSASLWIIAQIPTDKILVSASILLGIMYTLLSVVTILSLPVFNEKKLASIGTMFLGLGVGLFALVGSLKLLTYMSWDTISDGMGKLVTIVTLLGLASRIAGKGKVSGFIGMAVAVDLLVPAIWALGHMDSRNAMQGVIAVEAIVLGLGISSRIAGKGKLGGLMGMAVAVDLLVPAIKILGEMDTKDAVQGTAVIEAVMLGLAGSARLAGKNNGSIKSMIGLILETAVATAAIYVLAKIPVANVLSAAGALAAVVLAVAGASQLARANFSAVITMGIVLAEAVAALWLLTKLDTSALLTATKGLAVTLASVSLAIALLQNVPFSGGIKAAVAFGSFMAIMLGVMYLIGEINEWAGENIAEKIQPVVELFGIVGEAIGSFVGGVLDGILDAIDPLKRLGESMEEFWAHASVFFDGVSQLPDGTLDGVEAVAAAMIAFLGAEFIQGLMDNPLVKALMGGTNPLEDFIEMLADLTEKDGALYRFIEASGNLPEDSIDRAKFAAEIITSIAQAAKDIPNTGGWLGDIVGNNDIDDFMEMCADMAPNMRVYLRSVSGFTEDDKANSELAMSILSGIIKIASDIPNSGGALGWLVGNNDIDEFVAKVSKMTPDLQSYLRQIQNESFNKEVLDRSDTLMECLATIIDKAKDIPNSGKSVVSFFVGDNAIDDFCDMLPSVARHLKKYFAAIGPGENGSAVSRSDVVRSGLAMEALATIIEQANNIPRVDAEWLASIFGSDDITAFTAGLADVAWDLQDYMEIIADIPMDALTSSNSVMKALDGIVSLANTISSYGDERLDSFGDNLASLGTGLRNFIDDCSTISDDEISRNDKIIDMILDIDSLKNSITEKGDERLDSFGDNLKELGIGILSYYHQIENIDANTLTTKQALVASLVHAIEHLISEGGFDNMQKASNALTTFGNAYASYYTDIKSIDTNNVSKVCESIAKIINTFIKMKTVDQDTVKSFGDTMFAVSNAGCTRFINRFSLTHEEVKAVIADYIYAAGDACNENSQTLTESFYNLGSDVAQGFIDGVNDQIPNATNKAYDLAMETLETIRTVFDSHSPSRETAKLGVYFGQGLANGIISMIPETVKATENMASTAMNGLASAFKPIDQVVRSGMEVDTTIRPLYDMGGLKYGNSQIMSALNQQSFKMAATNGRAMADSITNSIDGLDIDNTEVVNAIEKLQSDVIKLNENISKMQIVMDTGVVVGQIAAPLDYEYGRRSVYASRRN